MTDQQHTDKLDANDDGQWSQSYDIDADDTPDHNHNINNNDNNIDTRTCRKTSYPHIFQLYMFSGNLFSPGTFKISSSNKFYWQRITSAHNIPLKLLDAEIANLNRLVLWYMIIPKLLWIIPWICLPIGVIIYAVEDGYTHSHPNSPSHEVHYHLFWSYNGLFIFVGGGIGGVLLATQLWNHCWYLCIKAMAKQINELNNNILWLNKYCVSFDMQCDIPVLAGRSYGRAYYKIVITIHHDYLLSHNHDNNKEAAPQHMEIKTPSMKEKEDNAIHSHPMIISLKQPERDTRSSENVKDAADENMDLFKSLHTSFRRRQETSGMSMSLSMAPQSHIQQPVTMSVTQGQIPIPQQTKVNYIRQTSSSQRVMSMMEDHDERSEQEQHAERDLMEEKAELQVVEKSKDNDVKAKSAPDLAEVGKEERLNEMERKQEKEEKPQRFSQLSKAYSTQTVDVKTRGTRQASRSAYIQRPSTLKQQSSVFNMGGFVSRSVLDNNSTRAMLRESRQSKSKKKKQNDEDEFSFSDD